MSECADKRRYRTKPAAKTALKAQAGQIGRKSLTCYRCHQCGGWHLTSLTKTELKNYKRRHE